MPVLKVKLTYRNEAENQLASELLAKRWMVTKKGWPDFFCLDEHGNGMVVEVKKRSTDRLKTSQERMFKFLVKHGVRCYRYAPDSGLEEYHE